MEDKKLNFNRPLLSVRRVTSKEKDSKKKNLNSSAPAVLHPSPSTKSDMHSGPLRDPGSVPFVWEQSPGKPKDERKTHKKHPIVPKLPPGRLLTKPQKQDVYIITNDDGGKGDLYVDATDISPRINEKPREVKKVVVNKGNEQPKLTYGPNFLQLNDDNGDKEDSESDYDEHDNMSYKVCGLLPHFCFKGSSVGLLNPIPGLSVRSRLPISTASKPRSASATVSSKAQPARVAADEHKTSVTKQIDQTDSKNDLTGATNQKDPRQLEGPGMYDHLKDREISNNHSESFMPPVCEGTALNLPKRGLVSFKELLAYENEKEANSQNSAVEKTLYVDAIHNVKSAKPDFKANDVDILGTLLMPTEPFKSDLLADMLKEEKEMIKQINVCKDPKVDQKVKVSRQHGSDLPAPPPLPKSPSDSWLWRTLPSVSSKTSTSVRSNRKCHSNTTAKLDKNIQSQYPQGLLFPIPET
uniref:uncharacterized protein LOC122579673 n=1 Tax=Erigeron canadensis TaxID=72917 RepID=UPI001CB907C9|nr:uncharacterized protein LOC122579673 [Erigeron canadensis]XP_043607838.1 uncharacterized protein LOC122579673 [Erigeron canadensis]